MRKLVDYLAEYGYGRPQNNAVLIHKGQRVKAITKDDWSRRFCVLVYADDSTARVLVEELIGVQK